MAGLTDEQQEKLAIIEEKLKAKGITMTAAQKAILVSKGSMMSIMAGDTGQPEQTPAPVPDPMKIQETFPKEAQQADKSRKAAQDKRDAEIKADIEKQRLAAESE
jgi:hypothetical protein|tara:strand:- start:739 stop:1053 length:315 start_codon:yes stop_codon:yes gene_type:complete